MPSLRLFGNSDFEAFVAAYWELPDRQRTVISFSVPHPTRQGTNGTMCHLDCGNRPYLHFDPNFLNSKDGSRQGLISRVFVGDYLQDDAIALVFTEPQPWWRVVEDLERCGIYFPDSPNKRL